MNHFQYLVDEDAGAFFQKAACDNAESVHKVPVPRPEPEPMAKVASVRSDFEKVASRLERDIGILKTAGDCGVDFGMCRRASMYIDALFADTNLEPDEFAAVFDKVAAEAIETDLNAAWDQLSGECDEELHPWLEGQFAKIGFDMCTQAALEKQAIVGALLRGGAKLLARSRAGGAAARAVTGAAVRRAGGAVAGAARRVGKAVATAPARAGRATRSAYGRLRVPQARGKLKMLESQIRATKGTGIAAQAAKKSLMKQHQGARASLERNLRRQKGLAGKPPVAPAPPGAPAGTTAPKGAAAPTTTKQVKQKQVETKQQTERAKVEAAGAAKLPAAAASKDPKFLDTWKKMSTGGWKGLSAEEKGTMIRGGVHGALGYRAVTGKGALTGGEGVI